MWLVATVLYSMGLDVHVSLECLVQKIPLLCTSLYKASLIAQSVKNLPDLQETQVWSLGQEDPLEKEIATYSSILA